MSKASEVIGMIVMVVIYLLVGALISWPYNWLASGTSQSFAGTAIAAPIIAALLGLLYWLRYHGPRHPSLSNMPYRDKVDKWSGRIFWTLLIYFTLPIILNGISILLKVIGWPAVSQWVFSLRYNIVLYTPGVLLGLFVAFIIVAQVVTWFQKLFRRRATPPSASPPADNIVGSNEEPAKQHPPNITTLQCESA